MSVLTLSRSVYTNVTIQVSISSRVQVEMILERVSSVQCAECYYSCNAFSSVAGDAYSLLRERVPWAQGSVRVRGKVWAERRLTCLFSDSPGTTYHYSGKEMVGQEWDRVVWGIREDLYRMCRREYPGWKDSWKFDTCLCNYYRPREEVEVEGEKWKPDVIGLHADSEQDLIMDRPIASVSFGVVRRFDLVPNPETKGKYTMAPVQHDVVQTYLASGSVFVMGRGCQRYYKHQVPAEKKVEGGRINLTFRMTKGAV